MQSYDVTMYRCLIQQGANIAMVNNDGELPIDLAESNVMTQLLNTEMDKQGIMLYFITLCCLL